MKRTLLVHVFAAMVLSVSASASLATDESSLKAAYLYNFTKFIRWPDEQRANLTLCSMGDEELAKALDSLVGKPVRNMQIRVRQVVNVQDTVQCDLVFIPAGQPHLIERVCQAVSGHPILTVSESADMLPKGVMLALIQKDNRMGFEIDLVATRSHGFEVSAKLLQLARKVY